MLDRHLTQAERHIAEGEDHVTRQRQIVLELANDGGDLRTAQALLAQLEMMPAQHIADRERIRAEQR